MHPSSQMKITSAFFAVVLLCCAQMLVDAQARNHLFWVVQNGLVGYIDQRGKVVIKPQFMRGWKFSEGLACVVDKSGKTGFIDGTGVYLIPAQFNSTYGCFNKFREGVAAISIGDRYRDRKFVNEEKWGYVYPDGKVKLFPGVTFLSNFREGLAFFHKGERTGYFNQKFEIAIPPKFKSAGDFYSGRARAETLDGREVYIDQKGKELFPGGGEFQDSKAFVKRHGKYGFIDLKGKLIVEAKFDDATHFGEGLAGVKIGKKWGFVNERGEVVIKPQFDSVGVFAEGLVSIEVNGKWGFIDKTEKIVIPPQFDKWTYYFENGLCEVHVGDKTGYIDHAGNFVWPLTK